MLSFLQRLFAQALAFYENGGAVRKRAIIAAIGLILCALHTGLYGAAAWTQYGGGDWDLFYFTAETSRIIIQEYGEIPQWNPWSRGGVEMFANPQTLHFSFHFFLFFLFSTPVALKLGFLLFYWIGFMGTYALLKRLGRPTPIAIFGAYIFTFCSFFTWHIICVCHPNTTGLFFTPWLLYFYYDYKQNGLKLLNFIAPTLIFAHLILSGSSYPMVYMPIFFVLYALTEGWSEKRSLKLAVYATSVVVIGYGLTLWKLFPSYVYMSQNPRLVKDESYINLIGVLQSLADRPNSHLPIEISLTNWGWWEHAAYFELIGIFILIYYGKELGLKRAWLFLLGFIVWWSMGDFPKGLPNPWYIANHYLPVFKSFRVPYRFEIFYIFLLCLWLTALLTKKYKEHPLWRLVMLAWVANLYILNNSVHQTLYHSTPLKALTAGARFNTDAPFMQKCGTLSVPTVSFAPPAYMYPLLLQNIGTLKAYEPLDLPFDGFKNCEGDTIFPLVEKYDAELLKWTPSGFTLKVKNGEGFLIKQNFSNGWKIIDGKGKISNKRNLLFLTAESGAVVTLRYTNPDIPTGLALTTPFALIFVSGIFYLAFKPKKRAPASV